MIVPDLPSVCDRSVEVNKMRPTSSEPAADVGFRDGVSTHFDALGDAADGECW